MDGVEVDIWMLENQLFPTPAPVVDRMLEPWVIDYDRYGARLDAKPAAGYRLSVCDPQAGTGAILARIDQRFGSRSRHEFDLYACEIDYQLRTVLSESFEVIGTDWLLYDDPLKFDLIVSNPPFDNGAAHALKNIEHLAPGGKMACLLNAETIRNPYTKERRLLLGKLAMNWGVNPGHYGLYDARLALSGEGIEMGQGVYSLLADLEQLGALSWFGQCFKDAERPTDVDVVCIWYNAPAQKQTRIDWEQGDFADGPDIDSPEFKANPLAHASAIKTLVAKYRRSLTLVEARMQAQGELAYYLEDLSPDYGGKSDLYLKLGFAEQVQRLKALYWNTIFTKTDLGNRIGSQARKSFEDFATKQKRLEFNERNIVEMLQMLLGSIDQVMHQLVVDTFDAMVGYHVDNKRHSEGWKTNAPGKIKNQKVIIPNGIFYAYSTNYGYKHETWRMNKENFFADLDKALCWVTGKNHKDLDDRGITTYDAISKHLTACGRYQEPVRHDEKFESVFFEIRIYKKGTVHLWFKDGAVAQDFQKAANEGRKWLAEQDAAA